MAALSGYNPGMSLLPAGSGTIQPMSGGSMGPPPGFDPARTLIPASGGEIAPYKGGFFEEPISIGGAPTPPATATAPAPLPDTTGNRAVAVAAAREESEKATSPPITAITPVKTPGKPTVAPVTAPVTTPVTAPAPITVDADKIPAKPTTPSSIPNDPATPVKNDKKDIVLFGTPLTLEDPSKGTGSEFTKSQIDALTLFGLDGSGTTPTEKKEVIQALYDGKCNSDKPLAMLVNCEPVRRIVQSLALNLLSKLQPGDKNTTSNISKEEQPEVRYDEMSDGSMKVCITFKPKSLSLLSKYIPPSPVNKKKKNASNSTTLPSGPNGSTITSSTASPIVLMDKEKKGENSITSESEVIKPQIDAVATTDSAEGIDSTNKTKKQSLINRFLSGMRKLFTRSPKDSKPVPIEIKLESFRKKVNNSSVVISPGTLTLIENYFEDISKEDEDLVKDLITALEKKSGTTLNPSDRKKLVSYFEDVELIKLKNHSEYELNNDATRNIANVFQNHPEININTSVANSDTIKPLILDILNRLKERKDAEAAALTAELEKLPEEKLETLETIASELNPRSPAMPEFIPSLETIEEASNENNNNNNGNAGTGPGFKPPPVLDSTPIVPDDASAPPRSAKNGTPRVPVAPYAARGLRAPVGEELGKSPKILSPPKNATANLKLRTGFNRPVNNNNNKGIELTALPNKPAQKASNNNNVSRAAAIAAAKEELAAKKAKNAIKKEENNAEAVAAAKKANNNKTPKGSNNTTPKSNKSNKSNNKVTPKQYSKRNISNFTQKLNVLSRNLQAKQRSFKTPNRAATIKSINSNKQTLKGKTGMSSNVIRNSLTKIKNKYANVNTGKRLTLSGGKRTTFKKSTALKTRRSMKKQRETK